MIPIKLKVSIPSIRKKVHKEVCNSRIAEAKAHT